MVKEINVTGSMERKGCNSSMKYGLREDDVRFKHGVTEEIRLLVKIPGDSCKPLSANFSLTVANHHSMN